jgi:hypothetical protein
MVSAGKSCRSAFVVIAEDDNADKAQQKIINSFFN